MRLHVSPGGGMLSISLSSGNVAKAAENYTADYDIVFNPTGTHLKDYQYDDFAKEYSGYLKIRLDFYPHEGTKAYEQQHVYVPIEPVPPYSGKVDVEGNPIDWDDYNHWWDSLPREWRTNPALCLFVRVDTNTTVADLQNYIDTTFTMEMMSTIDDVIVQKDSAHLISPLLRNKGVITTGYSFGDKTDIITDTNVKFTDFAVSGDESGISRDIQPQSIDIGTAAIDRASQTSMNGRSAIAEENPANADGTLDTIEVWFVATQYTVYIGTVSMSGNDATTRDYEDFGLVDGGSKQTFSSPGDFSAIACVTGDYLGVSVEVTAGSIERDSSGTGYWLSGETSGIGLDDLSSTGLSHYATRTISLYGTGTEGGGGDPEITVSPTDYDFGVVAESTTPYTATDYFTITNNSTMQTDQTIAVTTSTWSGGVTWTHSDTATAGSDTAGLLANQDGTWGVGDVIVKYSSPNYIYENCPATTSYDFGLKLISPTAFTDGVEKEIIVRITATAD